MDTKLSRYAAVAERVFVDRYEQACPVGKVVISRWEPRWEVRVSFLTRDVAEAFAKALQEAKAPTESPFSKVRESAARLGETIAEWDAKFGNKPPNDREQCYDALCDMRTLTTANARIQGPSPARGEGPLE